MNKRESMIRAYIRRMEQVAQLATEMNDIERKFGLQFGQNIKDHLVIEGTRQMVERAAQRVARPADEETPVATGDTSPFYGEALGMPRRRS